MAADGTIDLSFGGPADPPDRLRALGQPGRRPGSSELRLACIRAEERFGNGDHLFDLGRAEPRPRTPSTTRPRDSQLHWLAAPVSGSAWKSNF